MQEAPHRGNPPVGRFRFSASIGGVGPWPGTPAQGMDSGALVIDDDVHKVRVKREVILDRGNIGER